MQIIEMVESPPALLKLVHSETMDLKGVVDSVVIGAFMTDMDGTVGTFVPDTKTVYLDLGNALINNALYNKGMMFIPNVWYTILWALGHEIEHACQLEAELRLIEYEKLPQQYEDLAMEAGEDLVLRWSKLNTIPPIDQLGWLGSQLVIMLNAMYTKHPEVSDEPDLLAHGAAASLEAVFANWEFTPEGRSELIDQIDEGQIGLKIGGDRYLTAYEFLGLEAI